jgi:DNA-binding response OmpR family regulator
MGLVPSANRSTLKVNLQTHNALDGATMRQKILVVDDDRLTRRSLSLHLEDAGYEAIVAGDGAEAIELAELHHPDLILLDVVMPGMDGHEVLRKLQSHADRIPVIYVTARRRELDELVGLELGADDYVTKPFDIDILLARIKAVLRRTAMPADSGVSKPIQVGDLYIDPVAHVARMGQEEIEFTPKEFDLLLYLAENASQVVSVEQILDNVWGEGWIGEDQTVYVHIRWLRTKIEEDPRNPKRLLTIRGVGYKLIPI